MKIKPLLKYGSSALAGYYFRCPGCMDEHHIDLTWSFNGNVDRPTISPSVLVTGPTTVQNADYEWTGKYVMGANNEPIPMVCHSFITDGNIQFLTDCTHDLAGQTVPLPDFP